MPTLMVPSVHPHITQVSAGSVSVPSPLPMYSGQTIGMVQPTVAGSGGGGPDPEPEDVAVGYPIAG